jgi:hypothetical protein
MKASFRAAESKYQAAYRAGAASNLEINDKNGWEYDPNAALRRVRAEREAFESGWKAAIETAAKVMCEWCAEGKPISEPPYGRLRERWHIPFPETPSDTQRVRCQAEKIFTARVVTGKEK